MTKAELLKTAKPILFNTYMVMSIQNRWKTVTRRVLKNQDENAFTYEWNYKDGMKDDVDLICDRNGEVYSLANKPPFHIGDILYVRETWGRYSVCEGIMPTILYKADGNPPDKIKWIPSIHMPKEAARIFLQVTDVRVERLQEIDADGIRNEGLTSMAVHVGDMEIAQAEFALLWDTTVKKSDLDRYGWAANPWVWVIEFERVEVPNEQH